MTALDDHRHLSRVTIWVTCAFALVLALVCLVTNHSASALSVLAGSAIGVVDTLMLSRGLTRFGKSDNGLSPSALTAGLLGRFASVGIVLGAVLTLHQLQPIAVIAGFLLMPVAIGVAGGSAIRREARVANAG